MHLTKSIIKIVARTVNSCYLLAEKVSLDKLSYQLPIQIFVLNARFSLGLLNLGLCNLHKESIHSSFGNYVIIFAIR